MDACKDIYSSGFIIKARKVLLYLRNKNVMLVSMDYPRFCEGCTCVPDGVTAEVRSVSLPTTRELSLLSEGTGREEVADYARVNVVVVESSNPEIAVGDSSRFVIESNGRSAEEIREDIRNCQGPPTSMARFFRTVVGNGTCNAVKITRQARG